MILGRPNQLLIDFVPTSHQLRSNFVPTSYRLRSNFVSTWYEIGTELIRKLPKGQVTKDE